MRILLPYQGVALRKWHIDAGVHPDDPNLRITKCGLKYAYGGRIGPQVLRHFYCGECFIDANCRTV